MICVLPSLIPAFSPAEKEKIAGRFEAGNHGAGKVIRHGVKASFSKSDFVRKMAVCGFCAEAVRVRTGHHCARSGALPEHEHLVK
jgi:hypothetical protein